MSLKQIKTITDGPRQSNMELLRILATLLVLILHANFNCLGMPTRDELFSAPSIVFFRAILEFLSCVAVNVFILISGWFGIRATFKGIYKLLFQSSFFIALAMVISLFRGGEIDIKSVVNLFTSYKLWFIPAYIGLYILSPILNSYVNCVSKDTLKKTLISYYIFQTIYGYFTPFMDVIGHGYSTISFTGLYLLSSYLRRYPIRKLSYYSLGLYFIAAVINALGFILILNFHPTAAGSLSGYINPLTIIGAVSLTVYFTNMNIRHNKIINWIAISSFGAFLFHSAFWGLYKQSMVNISWDWCGLTQVGLQLMVILVFFTLGILLDKIRMLIWARVDKYFNNKI